MEEQNKIRHEWTKEEEELLVERYEKGIAPETLAAEMGRSVKSIWFRLERLLHVSNPYRTKPAQWRNPYGKFMRAAYHKPGEQIDHPQWGPCTVISETGKGLRLKLADGKVRFVTKQ